MDCSSEDDSHGHGGHDPNDDGCEDKEIVIVDKWTLR
jgi:hypothetical protein